MTPHVHMLDLDRPSRPRLRKSACKDCVAREAELTRLREDLFASRQAALSEGVRYAGLLEAVKEEAERIGRECDIAPEHRTARETSLLEVQRRLRQLIEENDG